ncbi:INO80 complex subunit B [Aplysia californica]|uniref:INO80 complex subunit B n=1 Tax=Aplysia californica TaxID=6500 RepID=A0ABM0K2K0_APLCA|nr:INO80 complex subunit B [Aplysia californica]XP_035828022.1 INO80 complex subunit B [Aplysia californica]
MELEEVSPVAGPSKKHKKHKKKHKHRRESDHGDRGIVSPKTSIKLKLKIGRETMGTKNVMSIIQAPPDDEVHPPQGGEKLPKKGTNDDDDISDEEKWLDALEKGTLDSYGELSKKDPALLTTRQRALLHGSQQDELLQLPSGYKTVELTDEQKRRRQEKAKRRRQQANEKIENDKNETVNKLLKKQESKLKRAGKMRGGKRSNAPRAVYKNRLDGISLNFPGDMPFPFTAQTASPYPMAETCGVDGCQNRKTSVCSQSLVPVCGLLCYRKNLEAWRSSQFLEQVPIPQEAG